jgi:hypothetical protein
MTDHDHSHPQWVIPAAGKESTAESSALPSAPGPGAVPPAAAATEGPSRRWRRRATARGTVSGRGRGVIAGVAAAALLIVGGAGGAALATDGGPGPGGVVINAGDPDGPGDRGDRGDRGD